MSLFRDRESGLSSSDEVVEAAVERFNEWLVDDPNQNPSPNQYKERVFFYGDDILFSHDINDERYDVISKAFFFTIYKDRKYRICTRTETNSYRCLSV